MRRRRYAVTLASRAICPVPALAAPRSMARQLSWLWALPFAGMLLSIATGPLLFPKLWHHHYGKFALGWAL